MFFFYSFVYFFIALPEGSVRRFIFFYKFNCTDIQVYNWEIRHHLLVRCCGLADILYILESTERVILILFSFLFFNLFHFYLYFTVF